MGFLLIQSAVLLVLAVAVQSWVPVKLIGPWTYVKHPYGPHSPCLKNCPPPGRCFVNSFGAVKCKCPLGAIATPYGCKPPPVFPPVCPVCPYPGKCISHGGPPVCQCPLGFRFTPYGCKPACQACPPPGKCVVLGPHPVCKCPHPYIKTPYGCKPPPIFPVKHIYPIKPAYPVKPIIPIHPPQPW